ncbi:MAG: DUF2877 domain-containing protein [Thermoplasmata archaeon]
MIHVLQSGLRLLPQDDGKVIQVSPRAVNILFGGRVITLLTSNGILTPSSIILNVEHIPTISRARFSEENLLTDIFEVKMENKIDLKLNLKGVVDSNVLITFLRPYIVPRNRSIMTAVILAEKSNGILLPDGFETEVIKEEARRIEKYDKIEDLTKNILGLGFGLTPSGDDFILGVVAAMKLLGMETESIRPIVMSYDNLLSRTSLLDGLDGYFSRPLLGLIDAILVGRDVESSIVKLEGIGHTSGFDVVAGMYHGAKLMRDYI